MQDMKLESRTLECKQICLTCTQSRIRDCPDRIFLETRDAVICEVLREVKLEKEKLIARDMDVDSNTRLGDRYRGVA